MDEDIIGYCFYCKRPIYCDTDYMEVDEKLYHYSESNPVENCYFPESEDMYDD